MLSKIIRVNCEEKDSIWVFSFGRPPHLDGQERGKMSMTMVKTAPLARQGKVMNEKTDVGIGISSVELVFVVKDNVGNGRW